MNGPLILRSEDQSQQGSHVHQIKNNKNANIGATVHARAAEWLKKWDETKGHVILLRWKKCGGDRQTEREQSGSASPPTRKYGASFVAN